jgi:hypothetical protein
VSLLDQGQGATADAGLLAERDLSQIALLAKLADRLAERWLWPI